MIRGDQFGVMLRREFYPFRSRFYIYPIHRITNVAQYGTQRRFLQIVEDRPAMTSIQQVKYILESTLNCYVCLLYTSGGLASFQRETIIRHADLIPGLKDMIQEETVNCVTFDAILAKLQSNTLDLLQIDTEGADAHILSLFPFHRMLPAIVHWEVKHLSMRQREDCLGRLASIGYRFAPSGDQDMVAVQL